MDSQTHKTNKHRDSKYYCSFCKVNANDRMSVFSIRQTFWFVLMKQPDMVNACESCVKKIMLDVLRLQLENENCFTLREKLLEKAITEEYIATRTARHIIQKLFIKSPKRPNDAIEAETQDSKRQKLDISHESGNTTTLVAVRGTMVGGGMPGAKKKDVNSQSQSQPDLQFNSQNNRNSSRRVSNVNEEAHDGISSDSSSDEESDIEHEPIALGDEQPIESAIAPRQVPRIRQPQSDGLRLVGA